MSVPNHSRVNALGLAISLFLLAGCDPAASPGSGSATGSVQTADDEAMLSYLERTIAIAKDKFVDLAEAMPESSYGWRPMEGVRSVGEVFIHVAADNWFGPALLGIPAPAETGVTEEESTVQAYQERDLPKAQIVAEVEASFDHMLQAVEATRGQLGTETTLRSNPITYGDIWVRLVTHMHEHLGQSVAYARANEVVPPWSR